MSSANGRRGPASNGTAAEVLVLGQLLRRNIEAYQTPQATFGHDIVAVIGARAVRIEVKSKQKITLGKYIQISRAPLLHADVLIVVDLQTDLSDRERYFIFPVAVALAVQFEPTSENPEGYHAGFKMSDIPDVNTYLEAWHHITASARDQTTP